MEHELNEKLLVLAVNFVEVELAFDVGHRPDLAKFVKMLGHVGGEHRLDNNMAAAREVFTGHVDGPVAVLVLGHERESCGQMMIFEHAYIVVPHGDLIIHID